MFLGSRYPECLWSVEAPSIKQRSCIYIMFPIWRHFSFMTLKSCIHVSCDGNKPFILCTAPLGDCGCLFSGFGKDQALIPSCLLCCLSLFSNIQTSSKLQQNTNTSFVCFHMPLTPSAHTPCIVGLFSAHISPTSCGFFSFLCDVLMFLCVVCRSDLLLQTSISWMRTESCGWLIRA